MKKVFAFFFAVLSGLYLMTIGLAPDPLPIIDEAAAFLILVKSLSILGIDLGRFLPFLPFLGRKGPRRKAGRRAGRVVDV